MEAQGRDTSWDKAEMGALAAAIAALTGVSPEQERDTHFEIEEDRS
jgi:phage protein D